MSDGDNSRTLPGAFDARFRIGAEDFFTDIRANVLSRKTFTMRYQTASGEGPIVLSWDPTGLAALGTFEIVDDVTGTLFGPLDMTSTNAIDGDLNHDGKSIGFFGTTPTTNKSVSGGAGANAALISLLNALDQYGPITDSSS